MVFGGMLLIALTTVSIVLIGNCNHDRPYLDAVKIPSDPARPHKIPKPILHKTY